MEHMKKLFNLIGNAADTLDKVADARGVSRATKITLLSELILAMVEEANAITKELDELRKYKDEHTKARGETEELAEKRRDPYGTAFDGLQ